MLRVLLAALVISMVLTGCGKKEAKEKKRKKAEQKKALEAEQSKALQAEKS